MDARFTDSDAARVFPNRVAIVLFVARIPCCGRLQRPGTPTENHKVRLLGTPARSSGAAHASSLFILWFEFIPSVKLPKLFAGLENVTLAWVVNGGGGEVLFWLELSL